MRAIESATNVVYSAAYLRSHRTGRLRSFPAHKEFRAGGQRDSILEAQAYSWTAYQICHRHGHWLMSRRVFPVVRPPVSPAKGQERVRESSAREREHEVCDASLDPHRVVDAVFYAPPPHTPTKLYIDGAFLLHQNSQERKKLRVRGMRPPTGCDTSQASLILTQEGQQHTARARGAGPLTASRCYIMSTVRCACPLLCEPESVCVSARHIG